MRTVGILAAGGFYHNNNLDPTVGVRYSF